MTPTDAAHCRHPGCKCLVSPGEHYCSDACRLADEDQRAHAHKPVQDPCPCEHSPCRDSA